MAFLYTIQYDMAFIIIQKITKKRLQNQGGPLGLGENGGASLRHFLGEITLIFVFVDSVCSSQPQKTNMS